MGNENPAELARLITLLIVLVVMGAVAYFAVYRAVLNGLRQHAREERERAYRPPAAPATHAGPPSARPKGYTGSKSLNFPGDK